MVVTANPTLIGRMVENVIDNGVRHNQLDGWLRVTAAELGDLTRLTVEGSGEVIDPAQVGDLAEPFRRLRADRIGSARGAGLGLSIVAAIASAHGGALALHAREHGGLRVVIDLPRTAVQRGAPRASPAAGDSGRCSPMRVLVVDDERGLADDIAEGLRDHGLAVDVVYDGLDAAAKVDLYPYDVVVLDRDLPGLGGDAVCRIIADGEDPAMVLMLTAAGSPAERVAGLPSAPTTTWPSRSTSPSSCSGCTRWRAADPGRPRVCSAWATSSSTRPGTSPPRGTPARPQRQGVRGAARAAGGQPRLRSPPSSC